MSAPVHLPFTLLVVEDDPASMELLKEFLGSLGHQVVALSDSTKAPAAVNSRRFDGIFLDLQMPGLDGFEVARQTRRSSRNASTPIIIVTANEDRDTMEKAFRAGGMFFLQKPLDRRKLNLLFQTIRGTLDSRRRSNARIPLAIEVTCSLGADSFAASSTEIAEEGMVVRSATPLKEETKLRLVFRLPGDWRQIIAQVLVAVAGGDGTFYLLFEDMVEEDRKRVKEVVARHSHL